MTPPRRPSQSLRLPHRRPPAAGAGTRSSRPRPLSPAAERQRRDASRDRRGDEPLEARDPALLPRPDDRHEPRSPGSARRTCAAPVTERLLHGALLLKAVALALREVPELNATWSGDELVRRDDVNVGVAISLRGGGLVAPGPAPHRRAHARRADARLPRPRLPRPRRLAAQLGDVRADDHRHEPRRARRRERLRRHLPAAGRDRRVRHARRAAVDLGGADPAVPGREREPLRRPPRHRRPPRRARSSRAVDRLLQEPEEL